MATAPKLLQYQWTVKKHHARSIVCHWLSGTVPFIQGSPMNSPPFKKIIDWLGKNMWWILFCGCSIHKHVPLVNTVVWHDTTGRQIPFWGGQSWADVNFLLFWFFCFSASFQKKQRVFSWLFLLLISFFCHLNLVAHWWTDCVALIAFWPKATNFYLWLFSQMSARYQNIVDNLLLSVCECSLTNLIQAALKTGKNM